MSDDIAPVKRSRSRVQRFNWLKASGMTRRGVLYRVRCAYCDRAGLMLLGEGYCTTGRAVSDPSEFWRSDTCMAVDHVVPLARGGADDASNFAMACEDCNRRKGALLSWTSPNMALVNGRWAR